VLARSFSSEVVDALARLFAECVRRELADEQRLGWLTLDRAGELLGITSDAVYRKVKKGKLDGRKFDGRWFVEVAELDRAIRGGEPQSG
jgi:hypothetical protein